LRPKQWIAVTPADLEARDGEIFWKVRRRDVVAIEIGRGRDQQISFVDARGNALVTVSPAYTARRLDAVAAFLGVRVA
jgi:hypothetical protein